MAYTVSYATGHDRLCREAPAAPDRLRSSHQTRHVCCSSTCTPSDTTSSNPVHVRPMSLAVKCCGDITVLDICLASVIMARAGCSRCTPSGSSWRANDGQTGKLISRVRTLQVREWWISDQGPGSHLALPFWIACSYTSTRVGRRAARSRSAAVSEGSAAQHAL
jgi:hypothetical protein